ncbi:hypothetical protein [Burkholderia sp. Ac-20365]|uniref:hypothetical protein n=1 Tax=Burkholderia sp. Ac-20365 TaxID=2703897 RepID=UPI00197B5FD3|nr:hypothetical protein [Burkholderia sp. Ac-20365]MBN3761099.1 hypothetical protein [Burkholderia sp. Ac-20365]
MKKLALLFALASVTICAVAAAPQPQGAADVPLRLTRSITPGGGVDDAGDVIVLLEPGPQGCHYFGELTKAQASRDMLNKLVDIGLNDDHVWAIRIFRRACASTVERVALQVDLGRPARFEVGAALVAHPVR